MTNKCSVCEEEGRYKLKLRYFDDSGMDGVFCNKHLAKMLSVTMWENLKKIDVKGKST